MRKYENFCDVLKNLEDLYQYDEPYDNVTMTGLVGLYEICFEQAWKMMKDILEKHGYEGAATGSPRFIIKTAYQSSMIEKEETWLMALAAGNHVAHAYNKVVALDIIRQTKEQFYELFSQLKKNIEENWLL